MYLKNIFKKTAIIYSIDSCLTQSVKIRKKWILKFLPMNIEKKGGLMHWVGSKEVQCQVCIKFLSLDNAIEFANNNNISYSLITSNVKKSANYGVSYANNFKIQLK